MFACLFAHACFDSFGDYVFLLRVVFFWLWRIHVAFACFGPAPVGIFLVINNVRVYDGPWFFCHVVTFLLGQWFLAFAMHIVFHDFVYVYRGFVSISIFGCCWFACGSCACFLRLCVRPMRVCLGSFGIRCAVDAFVSLWTRCFVAQS